MVEKQGSPDHDRKLIGLCDEGIELNLYSKNVAYKLIKNLDIAKFLKT